MYFSCFIKKRIYGCCIGICNNGFFCFYKLPREDFSIQSIRRNKTFVYGFIILTIIFTLGFGYTVLLLPKTIEITNCGVGLILDDTIYGNSKGFVSQNYTWKGLENSISEGNLLLYKIDNAMTYFKKYRDGYPDSIIYAENDLKKFLKENILSQFGDSVITPPELENPTRIKPTQILNLPMNTQNIINELDNYAIDSFLQANVSYLAADFVINKYSRKEIEYGLSELNSVKDDLDKIHRNYWTSARQEQISETIDGIYISLIVTTAVLIWISIIAFVLWNCNESSRVLLHCSYTFNGCCVVLIFVLLLLIFPISSILSDACQISNNIIQQGNFEIFDLNSDQTELLRICFKKDGSIAKHYHFTEQLDFAHVIINVNKELENLIKTQLPFADKIANLTYKSINEFLDNLHLEYPVINSVNKTNDLLNTLTNLYDDHSKFPECKILIDFWKMHEYKCPNNTYIINGTLGSPRYFF